MERKSVRVFTEREITDDEISKNVGEDIPNVRDMLFTALFHTFNKGSFADDHTANNSKGKQ